MFSQACPTAARIPTLRWEPPGALRESWRPVWEDEDESAGDDQDRVRVRTGMSAMTIGGEGWGDGGDDNASGDER